MMYYLTHDLIAHITVFQAIMLLIVLTNIYFSHRARRHSLPDKLPRVSILVPVRDEEVTIEACLCSLMGQTYADFEVLVLDDQSSDSTPVILQQIALEDDRLKVLKGSPAPPGIAGKNWACAQLAGQATGELLFFTDADTVHQTNMLAEIVSSMLGEKADMLTGFPRQVVKTWGERLLVPFFTWSSLNFIPLGLAYQLRTSVLSIAVGQMMVFKREAYQAVGGHTTLGTDILDDIVLARRINQSGLRWRVLSIADLIRCRMYRSNREAS
ncbi:MAG TPA: glycosyltransferase, partial [Anaerolineales bacterium]|nr:glycosyltransferase [Anaerolineales bacterium]